MLCKVFLTVVKRSSEVSYNLLVVLITTFFSIFNYINILGYYILLRLAVVLY
jgi:hypothetical protein